jgi:hypothetical protein
MKCSKCYGQPKPHGWIFSHARDSCPKCGGTGATSPVGLQVEVRQQLVDAIYDGQPFRSVLRDLGLTSNQVWGLTRTEEDWP